MNPYLTEIVFLLDRSGSMGGLESDTIRGYNAFIEKQSTWDGKTLVTTILFDDRYEVLWDGIEAGRAKISNREYYVRGSTALLDAVGKTILDLSHRLSRAADHQYPGKVIFVITTDGLENSSREFTYKKIKALIKQQQEQCGWEFIFMGANIDTVREADNLGICRKNAHSFEASPEGLDLMYCMVSDLIEQKRKKE